MQKTTLRKRDLYLNRIIAFQDTEMIKVMTGIRRCGKSSLMKLMAEHLRDTGVTDDQIIEMNFESMRIPEMDARGFYEYVKTRICPDKRTYLFFDEVQKVRTLGKYYIVDIGLRNYLLGYRDGDSGHILENIIYFELLRRGYDVAIGKIDNQEVDFIATKADEKKYIQVTESMNAPETRERELAPLRKIRDSYEKAVIALESDLTQTQDGIKIIRALDFLLE